MSNVSLLQFTHLSKVLILFERTVSLNDENSDYTQ